jgi:hypothetical protein
MQRPRPRRPANGIIRNRQLRAIFGRSQEVSEAARVQVKRVIQERRVGCCRLIDLGESSPSSSSKTGGLTHEYCRRGNSPRESLELRTWHAG